MKKMNEHKSTKRNTIACASVTAALVAALGSFGAMPALAEPADPVEDVPITAQSDATLGIVGEEYAIAVARGYTGLIDPTFADVAMCGRVSTDAGLVWRVILEEPDGSGYRVDVGAYTGSVFECRYDDSCLFMTPAEAIDAVDAYTGESIVCWARDCDAVEGWFYYVATTDRVGNITVWQVDMLGNVYHTWMDLSDLINM